MQVSACPQCGAPAGAGDQRCCYCRAEFVINSTAQLASLERPALDKYIQFYRAATSSDSTGDAAMGLGLCYLKLRLYDLAAAQFKKVIESSPERSEAHLYMACALMKGRKPKVVSSKEMPDIEAFVNSALMLAPDEPRALLLQAAIKNDYYARNGMRVAPPTAAEIMARLRGKNTSRKCVEEILDLIPLSDESLAQAARAAATG